MPDVTASSVAGTRWAVRIIPVFIAAAFAFSTYVVVPHLCLDYLSREKNRTGTAVALLVLYFLFLVLTIATYLRTFWATQFDTGLVPLTAEREALEQNKKSKKKKKRRKDRKQDARDIEAQPWVIVPDMNPDSPGLEAFYSKDAFICEADGRPKWCSDCRTWKPDRAHHSSELDRCVRKMDHLCPWVGGMVSETSFNFFAQFTFYCTCYCALVLATTAYCLHLQKQDGKSLDARIVVGIALACLFGFFTSAMTVTSLRFMLLNTTSVDMLKKNQTYKIAVRVPTEVSTTTYGTITYPLPPRDPKVSSSTGPAYPVSLRDQQAKRTFAILTAEPGENPWNTGYWKNFKSVMGHNPLEWFLPIRRSPCCNHDSMVSDYEFGPLLDELKRRYGMAGGTAQPKNGERSRNGQAGA